MHHLRRKKPFLRFGRWTSRSPMSSAPAGFKSCSFCAVPGISHDLGGSFMVMACAELVLLLSASKATNSSEVLHSEIRQKDSARGSEVENAHEDSACLFGKSSLCRKYFSDEFSCRRALARDLFKEVSYLGIASPPSLATSASSATSDCSSESSPLPVYSLSPGLEYPHRHLCG